MRISTSRALNAALICLLMIALAVPALANAYPVAVVNNPDPADRLNLRVAPDVNATSLGKYYSGVEVYVLEETSVDWVKVLVGGTSGYMQRIYLAFDGRSVRSAMPIMIVNNPNPADRLHLRVTASVSSPSLSRYYNGTQVEVLGVAGEWLHVRVGERVGYMLAKYLRDAQIITYPCIAVVNNPDPADRLNLREYIPPDGSTTGYSLGKYYSGVEVEVRNEIDDKPGWASVRIGDTYGFMLMEYLAFGDSAASVPSAIPIMTIANLNPTDRLNLRELPKESAPSLAKYPNGTRVEVLGVVGDVWMHVRVNGRYGYMMSAYLR